MNSELRQSGVMEHRRAGKSSYRGQIEHSIGQTFAAPSRLLLEPGSGVGVARRIGYMIESVEMYSKRFDCEGQLGVRCQNVCESEYHYSIRVR
jgi:hypothetical protein